MEQRSPFLDVIEIPAIGALVYEHLDSQGRKQARLACRALSTLVSARKYPNPCRFRGFVHQLVKVLCTQVDTNISRLHLQLPDTPEEEHHMGLRLKQRKLQPKDLAIYGNRCKNSSRGDALAAAGLEFFMQRVQKVYVEEIVFPAGIAKVGIK
jgi:hypothetical protein